MALQKLGIIGAGSVGSAVAVAAATEGVAHEIAIHDIDGPRAEAESLDLLHGTPFTPRVDVIGGEDPGLLTGCDVIVLAAGAKQKPGQSRLELAGTNVAVCRAAMGTVRDVAPDAIVVVVTNPVDVLTHVAQQVHPGGNVGTVIGSGTVLDTARLRVLLGQHLGVAPSAVHATVIGEHGDSEFVLWSGATVGGTPVHRWLSDRGEEDDVLDAVLDEVRGAAQRIIAGKGATSTAIGMCTARIIRAIADDEGAVLPVSTGHDVAGVGRVCLSLPTIVDRLGASRSVPVQLTAEEQRSLEASARAIRAVIDATNGA